MSAPIHPELSRLHERYVQLVDGVRSGAVDAGEAYRLLEQITSFDAAGALWGVDQDGNFTRRVTPDAAPQVTPPGLYAAPAGPGQVASPFAPGIAHPVEQPIPAPVRIPPQRPLPANETQMPSDDSLVAGKRGRGQRRQAQPKSTRGWTAGAGGDGVLARFVAANRTTLFVAAAVAVVVVVAGITRPAAPAASTTISSAAPVSVPVGPLPTTDDFTRAVGLLLGGGDTAVQAVIDAGDTATSAAEAGRWLAWANGKLRVSAGPAAAVGAGAVQAWSVIDATGGVVQQLEASWVRTEAGWVLASWPRLK